MPQTSHCIMFFLVVITVQAQQVHSLCLACTVQDRMVILVTCHYSIFAVFAMVTDILQAQTVMKHKLQ